jgi:hypothetical protein
MKTITKQCLYCLQEFAADLKEHNRGYAKYCNQSCASKYFAARKPAKVPNVTCSCCYKQFYKNDSQKKNSKSGLYFCSRTCKDKAQTIKFGLSEIMPDHYGKGDGINSYRRLAFENYEPRCYRCRYDRFIPVLQVHHKDRNRRNNAIDNLIILCPTCHQEEHYLGSDGLYTYHEKNLVEDVGNDPT